MNVLFLADAVFDDLPGGSRVVARELARELAAAGHRVTFLVSRQNEQAPDEEQCGEIRIVRYPGAGQGAVFIRNGESACRRLIAKGERFDIVHTHFAYGAVGPLRALGEGVAQVRSFYGPWHEEGLVEDHSRLAAMPGASGVSRGLAIVKMRCRWLAKRRVETENLRRSRAVVVLSEHSRREVIDLKYPARRIHRIAPGVDIERFSTANRAGARARLGLPADRRILFSVRRLAPRMGLENLIAAMPAILQKYPDALLLIGGKGPRRAALEEAIRVAGLQESARLVGFIPDEQLADYYRAADLFVLPTVALEGFGLVTIEALACGTPVVATPVGATPEVLGALDARLIAPGSDPEALQKAVAGFFDGPCSLELHPERLREYVLERYTWKRHGEEIVRLYTDVRKQAEN